MSEYWKSTPKYWCKFCSIYVKDTKFERAQHEATGRHQGNIQRSLKGLHREQENENRQKSRAQAEIARLSGLVPAPSSSKSSVATGSGDKSTFVKRPEQKATLEDRKRQWEQLAAMGVQLPEEARADLALAGDWKTVSTEVVGEVNEDGEFKAVALNKGVRKRKLDEEEAEQQADAEAITKKKGWGNTYKSFPGSKGADDDLDSLFAKKTPQVKSESEFKPEPPVEDGVKDENKEGDDETSLKDIPTAEEAAKIADMVLKEEEGSQAKPAVVFKKRKKIAK